MSNGVGPHRNYGTSKGPPMLDGTKYVVAVLARARENGLTDAEVGAACEPYPGLALLVQQARLGQLTKPTPG